MSDWSTRGLRLTISYKLRQLAYTINNKDTAQGTQNPRLGALPVSSPVECCNLGLLPARLGDICVRGRELAGVNCQGHPLTI